MAGKDEPPALSIPSYSVALHGTGQGVLRDCRWHPPCGVEPNMVVMDAPVLDEDPHLLESEERFATEKFVPQVSVEVLIESIFFHELTGAT